MVANTCRLEYLAKYWKLKGLLRWQQANAYRSSNWILSRTACLGSDVFNLLGTEIPRLNIQKSRVDYLLLTSENVKYKANPCEIYNDLKRKDIFPFIIQEELFSLNFIKHPSFIFMDSFAELTDQLFTHREKGWGFCSHYTDLNVGGRFKDRFKCNGLLPVEDIYVHYSNFFSLVRRKYGNIPIVFLHFPAKLDERAVFHERASVILDSIEKISVELPLFYSIRIDDDCVDWPSGVSDDLKFPYHFHQSTYQAFVNEIISKEIFPRENK